MTRDEVKQIVWQEIGRALNIVLTGSSQNSDGQTEEIQNLLTGSGSTSDFPVAYPWGFASQTPDNTAQLVLQMGNSPLAKVIASHFDQNRPDINTGECILYNQFGQVVYCKQGKVVLGTQEANHPFVLGDLMNTFLNNLLTQIIAHTHAAPGVPPTNSAAFEALQTDVIESDELLSTIVVGV